MNKRGVIMDLFYVVALIFILAISVVIGKLVLTEYNTAIQGVDGASADAKNAVSDFNSKWAGNFDTGLLLAFIAAHIGIIILGLSLPTHPIMYPVLFIALIVVVLLSAFVANAYDEFATETEITNAADEFPITDWVFNNYLLVNLVMGFVDIVAFLSIRGVITGGGGGV